MVHINRVPTAKEVRDEKAQYEKVPASVAGIDLTAEDEPDDHTVTVYGSKYAAEDLPRHEMPDREMPSQVAYRMIKDDLTLDGTPTLNLASFVTTYMEEEAEKLMVYVAKELLELEANTFVVRHSQRTSLTTKSTLSAQISKTDVSL